jgi:hypothetical protein
MATSAASMVSHLRLVLRPFTVSKCPPARSHQSAHSLLPSRSVCQIGKRFTGELPQIVVVTPGLRRERYADVCCPPVNLLATYVDPHVNPRVYCGAPFHTPLIPPRSRAAVRWLRLRRPTMWPTLRSRG